MTRGLVLEGEADTAVAVHREGQTTSVVVLDEALLVYGAALAEIKDSEGDASWSTEREAVAEEEIAPAGVERHGLDTPMAAEKSGGDRQEKVALPGSGSRRYTPPDGDRHRIAVGRDSRGMADWGPRLLSVSACLAEHGGPGNSAPEIFEEALTFFWIVVRHL